MAVPLIVLQLEVNDICVSEDGCQENTGGQEEFYAKKKP